MLKHLKVMNIGPAPVMELDFGKRMNLITGDNGLGKSFLLDIAWWALTRKWPSEVNPQLTGGKKALPSGEGESQIAFSFSGKSKDESYESSYLRKEQTWTGRPGRPSNPGLVLYAMSDGSFAVWDPHRNYWRTQDGVDIQDRPAAYVFSPSEVWDGLSGQGGRSLCNGLIRDWSSWQLENGTAFKHLKEVLKRLSSSPKELLTPGELTRIDLDDVRDIPTIRMPYGQDVAVVFASAGMRRIMALAYFLVWAWEEHKKAAKLIQESPSNQVTFLIDEIESHLHPSWQRSIVPALISVMDTLTKKAQVQLIAATHSPLIMASVEPTFDEIQDRWFDIDFNHGEVLLTKRAYEKLGDVASWLVSDAFDLKSARPIEVEELIERAEELLDDPEVRPSAIREMHNALIHALGPRDHFYFRWRAICEHRGWLE